MNSGFRRIWLRLCSIKYSRIRIITVIIHHKKTEKMSISFFSVFFVFIWRLHKKQPDFFQVYAVYHVSSSLAARYNLKFPVLFRAIVRSSIRLLHSWHIYVWIGRFLSRLAINVSSSIDSILSQITHLTRITGHPNLLHVKSLYHIRILYTWLWNGLVIWNG